MNTVERLQMLPVAIKRTIIILQKTRIPWKVVYILSSVAATVWFLIRVIPKPSRAAYPCMQAAAPLMSGLVVWILAISGATFGFHRAKRKLAEARYFSALFFTVLAIAAISVYTLQSGAKPAVAKPATWYKANNPLGTAKGIFPGRVVWGHNPHIASWDGETGFWWEDRFNNQAESDKLLAQTLSGLTNRGNEEDAWDVLFHFFNQTKKNTVAGYKKGEKVVIKINQNNTDSHDNTNEINANPQLILSLLKSLVDEAGVPQENITLTDPSRFITNNIFDKCHAVYPDIHYIDHNGSDGREKASFVEEGFIYSFDFNGMTRGLATCFREADYVINLAIMKGHVSQGVSLCAKNFFGCTSIETDWRKNAHCGGFSQSREGKRQYSVYPDFIGHKDLGEKTVLYLIDGIYSNKSLNGVPNSRWSLAPFNKEWPGSLFASQDPVAIESVVLDFALAEWPDAPDMLYSDHAMEEMALAGNPPSGTVYDPERDGSRLSSLGTAEHWNNPADKQYSRNLSKEGKGIELVYSLVRNK